MRLLEFVRSFVELPVQHFSDILILYGQKLVNLLFPLSLLRLELTVFLFCQFFESFGPLVFLGLELCSKGIDMLNLCFIEVFPQVVELLGPIVQD